MPPVSPPSQLAVIASASQTLFGLVNFAGHLELRLA